MPRKAKRTKTRTTGSYASAEEHVCSRCRGTFNARGWPTHRAKCEREAQMEADDAAYMARLAIGSGPEGDINPGLLGARSTLCSHDEETASIWPSERPYDSIGVQSNEDNQVEASPEAFDVSGEVSSPFFEEFQAHPEQSEAGCQAAILENLEPGPLENDTDENDDWLDVDMEDVEGYCVMEDFSDMLAVEDDPLLPPQPLHIGDTNGDRDLGSLSAFDLKPGDVLTQFHPHSERTAEIVASEDYFNSQQPLPTLSDEEQERRPWQPFNTRLDFEFAELALDAKLNRPQIERLFRVIFDAVKDPDQFTLRGYSHLRKTWKKAEEIQTTFEKQEISVSYKTKDISFDLWTRPLWPWICDQLRQPCLVPHITWAAHRSYRLKEDGQWMRMVKGPMSANRAWNVQSKLPRGGYGLCLVVYADRSRLSSFGTAKAYPVMVGIGNIDMKIRNGNGVGGARVVGWLPIVAEDAKHRGKTTFTNFKRVVWHESFRHILDTIRSISRTGFMFPCADGINRLLFPYVHTLVADYEEQCVMTLIRGFKGLRACPRCLVPHEALSKMDQTHPPRDLEEVKAIVMDEEMSKSEKETLLKPLGMRDVQNAFWDVANSNPFDATSFDRLHSNHGGVFADHLYDTVQELVANAGREALGQIDEQAAALPRWRNLNHFASIMGVNFADGSKYEDISKIFVFVAHNVLTEDEHPTGYLLLRCIRAYLEHDMHIALELHTEDTLASGRECLAKFSQLLEEFSRVYPDKNWNIPKTHNNSHSYDDIEDKGVSPNFNTKPWEKRHGPFSDGYERQINFKNVADQLLKLEHRQWVSIMIRQLVDEYDWMISLEIKDTTKKTQRTVHGRYGDISLGSRAKEPSTFASIEDRNHEDPAYSKFRIALQNYLPRYSEAMAAKLGRNLLRFSPNDKIITEYKYMRVDFTSVVTWETQTDYLRCNPKFHGIPRYDGVIINTGGKVMFAKLVFIFEYSFEGITEPLALVWPLDAPTGPRSRKDKELGLIRVRAVPRVDCEFIPVQSIIRGAMLIENQEAADEFFVVDVVDTDMFMRMKGFREDGYL